MRSGRHSSISGRIARRALRIALKSAAYLVCAALGLVAAVFLLLAVPRLRAVVVQQAVAYANRSLEDYRIAVERVDRLDPWGVQARGIRVWDAQQREILRVPRVSVRIRPRALFERTLALTRVEVDGARAHLYLDGAAEQEASEEPPSAPSQFTYRVDSARLRDALLVVHGAERTFRAAVPSLVAAGRYGPRPALAIERAALRVRAGGEELLRLRSVQGRWSAGDGGQVALEGALAGARLSLRAQFPALSGADPWPIDGVQLELRGLTRGALSALGVQDGAQLRVPVDLTLDARARGDRLRVHAALEAGEARLSIRASADPRRYVLRAELPRARLSELSGMLPALEVEGALSVRATPGHRAQGKVMPDSAQLRWSDVAIDGAAVPAGELSVQLRPSEVRLVNLALEGFERALAVRGSYDWKRARGRAALDFDGFELGEIEVLRRRGLSGVLGGGLDVRFGPASLRGEGDLELRGFEHPSARAARLALSFALSGRPSAPRGELDLRAEGVTAGGVQLDAIRAEARVSRDAVSGELAIRGPDSALYARVQGARSEAGQLRLHGSGRGTLAGEPVRFDLRDLAYGERAVSLGELTLRSGAQQLRLRGTLGPGQALDLRLALSAVALARWTALTGIDARGRLDVRARVEGTTARPDVRVKLALTRASFDALPPVDARIRARADLATRHASLALALHASRPPATREGEPRAPSAREPLEARATVAVDLPRFPRDLLRAARRAQVAVDLRAQLPVAPLSALAGDALAGLEGALDLKLRANGTLERPELETELRARLKLAGEPGAARETVRLAASAGPEQLRAALWTGDQRGPLLTASGSLRWPGGSPGAALARPRAWAQARFALQAQLRERRLDRLEGALARVSELHAIALPVRAGGMLHVEGERGELDGALQLRAVVFSDQLDGRCAVGAQSALRFDAHLRKDRASAQLRVNARGGGVLEGKASARVALGSPAGSMFGPAKLALVGRDIALHELPGLCDLDAGRASLALEASALGGEGPALDARASISDLRAPGAEPLSVAARARADASRAELLVELEGGGRRVGALDARVGLADAGGLPSVALDAPLRARLWLDRLPLASALAFTDAVGSVGGSASADVKVGGTLGDPRPAGHLELNDARMMIARLAQPLRHVNGRIEVSGRSIKVERLTARDRDGKLRLEGRAKLGEDLRGELALDLEADEFPLRQQGTVVGELTTRARLNAQLSPDLQASGGLTIFDGRIWLTGARGKAVQALDRHPHVSFASEQTERAARPAADRSAERTGLRVASFQVHTERPLWIMHKDFSMQLDVDLALTQREGGAKLTGGAVIERGELQLLGKTFKIVKDSAIHFTGAVPPEPQLAIRAKYDPPTGEALVVEVSGPGSSPNLAFSGAANNVGEALAVLTGRSDARAQSQAADPTAAMASVASDLTAGLLIMAARREFGDWVPIITVETGRYGQPTRARAGFDASNLIPEWLEGIAKGAYVEGIVGTAPAGRGGGSIGVRLEIALPHDLITMFGIGSNAAWFTDIAWAP